MYFNCLLSQLIKTAADPEGCAGSGFGVCQPATGTGWVAPGNSPQPVGSIGGDLGGGALLIAINDS